ncbi:MAG TPA: nitronate monooxygenase [Candidatus Pacearchaeota archaeon]|nr:nitronate monooxygenase [Candidatus Parcubacteria bacterium]HNZ83930.1 nitronate monooxygenase [Candidatus Pacearchaeota archaeon]
MFENNKIVKLLGIKYPIIQGGMAGVSESILVSAVSNAGGLGTIGSGFATPAWLEEEIKKTRSLTDKPFAVNLLMQNPNVGELVKVIIKNKIPIVFTGGGNPVPIMPFLKGAGVKVIPVVPYARLAKKMEDIGADAVVVEGTESGGHIGESTTFCLIPQAKRLTEKIPVIAGGGIFNGRTMAAAMVLGADAVQVGTRFMATTECQIHENYKKAILDAKDEDIIVIARFTGHPVRVIKNEFTEKMEKFEKMNPFPEEVKADRFAGSKVGAGNTQVAPLLCGLCAGGVKDIKSCKEVIDEMVVEAQEATNDFVKEF